MSSITLSSGQRKYSPLWQKLRDTGKATVSCSPESVMTTIAGLKKEKSKKKDTPKGKVLKIETIFPDKPPFNKVVINFKLILDTSINNL